MKNIHILPTDKETRLHDTFGNLRLERGFEPSPCNKNIHITNDEEIKEGDWCYQVELNDGKVDKCYDVTLYHTWTNNGVDKTRKFKKIILTTDGDLIKDGVQAIDDEFLEWFIKNPSCEEVEVEDINNKATLEDGNIISVSVYKIIIPKEELKQETLEEAATKLLWKKYPYHPPLDSGYWQDMFIEGAKWQMERSYSEKEVLKLILTSSRLPFANDEERIEWFEQFKKK